MMIRLGPIARSIPGRWICALALAMLAIAAQGQETQEINRLIRAGQLGPAAERVEAILAKNPKDAQARFLKGVILSEQGKQTDAIGIFQSLTEDYPELPEPYNNLASLFAAKGQYEKAKTALEMAIQVNPSYGTAYENLGDVYAKLASQAYDKALQLDRGNTTAQGKLAALRSAFAAPATPSKPAPVAPAPAPRGEAKPSLAPAPAAAGAAVAPQPAAAAPSAIVPRPVSVPTTATAQPAGSDTAAVLKAVNAWVSAWSARDVDGYLSAYSKSFAPEGKSRDEWEALRRSTFPATGPVHVTIEQAQVSMLGDAQAEVTFVQHYRSERARLNTKKALKLSKEDGAWHIAQERILR